MTDDQLERTQTFYFDAKLNASQANVLKIQNTNAQQLFSASDAGLAQLQAR